ncbi:MAG: hypothetical protein ACYTGN_17260 [Planctomycetota bacterium]
MAKRLEGKPFHLVAAHNQAGERKPIVAYLKKNGVESTTPNFTATKSGRHPKVKGNGYVPYYMVFDHHGDLAHHHMCGAYHGGDGLKMIEWVDKLLKDAPVIYLGKTPFTRHAKLAKKIAAGKLPSALKQLEVLLKESRDLELLRLELAVNQYQKRRLLEIEGMLATNPPAVLPALRKLAKVFKGTEHEEVMEMNIAEQSKSPALKESVRIWKSFQKTVKRVEKLKDPKASTRNKQADKLDQLVEGHDELPVSATVRSYAASLRG